MFFRWFLIKKKLVPAFTFVEIIISISLTIIFTVVGIWSFDKFFKKSELMNIKSNILNILLSEKQKIIWQEISSYDIIFETWSKALFINENYYNNPYKIKFDNFDLISLSWVLSTNNTSTWVWSIRTYLDEKLFKTYLLTWSWEKLPFDFGSISDFNSIDIKSTINGIETNNFIIKRLDYNWREQENISDVIIDYMTWETSYKKVILKNILWNKQILVSTWISEEIYSWDVLIKIYKWSQEVIINTNEYD